MKKIFLSILISLLISGNAFAQSFNDSLTTQNEIYAKMSAKGWYPMEQVEQQKINQTKQKYSAQLN